MYNYRVRSTDPFPAFAHVLRIAAHAGKYGSILGPPLQLQQLPLQVMMAKFLELLDLYTLYDIVTHGTKIAEQHFHCIVFVFNLHIHTT